VSADAVVLVGGRGVRLQPLTLTTPKPLLPVAGLPFLDHPLSTLSAAGVQRAVLATSYRADLFDDYTTAGRGGIEVRCTEEKEPLGTGGGLRQAIERAETEDVLVLNGDLLSGVDVAALLAAHKRYAADVTLLLVRVPDVRPYGAVTYHDDGRVSAFLEKPSEPSAGPVNGGCFVVRRQVLESVPAGRPLSLENEVFPSLIAAGARFYGHVADPYWLDVGTLRGFLKANADLVRGVAPSAAVTAAPGEYVVLPGADVAPGVTPTAGTVIGRRNVVAPDVVLHGAVLFDDVTVDNGAVVCRSVLGHGVAVGRDCQVIDTMLGNGARLSPGVRLVSAKVPPGAVI
jgi:mannose-1-phosphate guanylyltransferase